VSTANGWPVYAVTGGGTLVYGAPIGAARVAPVWVDRDGSERVVDSEWYFRALPVYSSLALSPTDDSLAVSIPDESGAWHLWIKPLGSPGTPPKRLTSRGSLNYRPTWLGDGRALTYLSDRAGQSDLWRSDVATDEEAVRLVDAEDVVRNGVLSADGAWIVYREGEAPVADIFTAPVTEPERSRPLVATDAGERSPELSPDGRWVAYTTNAMGRWEVWVADLRDRATTRVRASVRGGEEPRWAHSGRELFYRSLENELIAVSIATEPSLRVGEPRLLFSMERYLRSDGRAQYDVSAADDRFVVLRLLDGGAVGLMRIDDFGLWLEMQR
jgi:Tol biopolymer transport system component